MLFSFLKLPDYNETLRVLLYITSYFMELQIHYISIVLNKFMNIFAIRTFPCFFPGDKCMCGHFLMRRVKIKLCQYFITKFHKEAS